MVYMYSNIPKAIFYLLKGDCIYTHIYIYMYIYGVEVLGSKYVL